jgi:GNAT superfamily N-acetyltransferase
VTTGHHSRGLLTISFRPARPSEVEYLRALVVRSMGHWAHPSGYLVEARQLMSLSAEDMRRDEAWVAVVDGAVAGFYRLSRADECAEIEEFHLEPPMIGRGIGRPMFQHATERARAVGARWLVWSTDTNALGFYLRMGGEITGTTPSGIAGGGATHVPAVGSSDAVTLAGAATLTR